MVILGDGGPVESISTLVKNRCCPKILLLASRLWNSVLNGRDVDEGGLDAIGIDEEGNAIHIVIERSHAAYYRDLLKEGHVYLFSNIGCIPAAHYRPIKRAERLRVNPGTKVQLVEDYMGVIKQYYFEFQSYANAASRLNKDTFLTDLIGVITKVEDPSAGNTKFGEGTRTKFYIQDLSGNEFPINLWGDLSLKFRECHVLESNKTVVVIVCSMAIRKYRDEVHASSMSPTKFYLNLDVPEVAEYLDRFAPLNIFPQILFKKGNSGFLKPASQETVQTRTIQDLISGPSDYVKPGQRYNCNAKVVDFDVNHGWFYSACKKCTRKLPPSETNLGCQKCNLGRSESMPWYRLEAMVEDTSAAATFTMFGRIVEKLIGASVEILVRSPIMDPQVLHPLMERVVGEARVFQVTLKQSTFGDGSVQIMVQDVFAETEDPTKVKLKDVDSGSSSVHSAESSITRASSTKRVVSDYCVADELPLNCVNKKNLASLQKSMLNGPSVSLTEYGAAVILNGDDISRKDVALPMQVDDAFKSSCANLAKKKGLLQHVRPKTGVVVPSGIGVGVDDGISSDGTESNGENWTAWKKLEMSKENWTAWKKLENENS